MKKKVQIVITFLFMFIQMFNMERIELISNGNFENKMLNWFTTSGKDKEVDFLKPDLVEKSPTPRLWNGERSKENFSILFNKPHGTYDKRPGLVKNFVIFTLL
jgi:hypothetical protein